MNTVATRAESYQSTPVECLTAQRQLVQLALDLMRRLPLRAENHGDLLRLGATCLSLAAEQAFGEHDDRKAVVLWAQCDAGERQIRSATYHVLRNGFIRNRDYDQIFASAKQARHARHDEMLRLRRRLRQLALV
jgi:hypothetical protein